MSKCKRCIHEQASIIDNNIAICAPCWLELYGDDNHNKDSSNMDTRVFHKGDKVTVKVAKSSDIEMQQLSGFGDEVSGIVIGQSGKILMVKTNKGIINPFVKDVIHEM